ncbi:hypothetical protein D3C71_2065560 [compost metagenome]
MAGNPRVARKQLADDQHFVMPSAGGRAGMAGMGRAVVAHGQAGGVEGRTQQRVDGGGVCSHPGSL